jgi:transcriptional regulator with XRE-family HTH domain
MTKIHLCAKLYAKGLTMKQVADRTNLSKAFVQRALQQVSVDTYYRQLISQCVKDLRSGIVCYCFTDEQLKDIKRLYPTLNHTYNGVGYTLYP